MRNRTPTEAASWTSPLAMLAPLVVGVLFSAVPAPASAVTCTKVISPGASVQKLIYALKAGQTGCLRAGTYSGNVKVSTGGTSAAAPITLTSYPGERATVAGKLWIADSANFVTVSSLNLDGRNSKSQPSPVVNGDDVVLADNDITNYHTAICISLGVTTYGRAHRTVVERNRVHDCGKLPPTNREHGIYVEDSTGVRIVDNVIYDNADRGVQFYPNADGSYVARNIIDGNGEGVIFSGGNEGAGPQASDFNVVENNIITNSKIRYNVESSWGAAPIGQGNVARSNCIYGGASGNIQSPQVGFTAGGNLVADPIYVNRAAKDFRLRSDSPCLTLFGGEGAGGPPPSDADGDDFSDQLETFIGTDPADACPDADQYRVSSSDPPGDNAWPVDINNDRFVNVSGDILGEAQRFGSTNPRYDVSAQDGIVTVSDVLTVASFFGPNPHCPG